jgi:hypothetical protein
MVFGRIRAERKRQRAYRDKRELQKLKKNPEPFNALKDAQKSQTQIDELASSSQKRQDLSRESGRKYAKDFMSQEVEGLNPKQRLALQESANAQIGGDLAGARRQLAAQQGRRGVSGGAAFAQQQEINKAAQDKQSEFQRDLTNLDAEQSMKKLAALFNIEQGFVGQDLYNEQAARDLLESREEKQRLKKNKKSSRSISRI